MINMGMVSLPFVRRAGGCGVGRSYDRAREDGVVEPSEISSL
jgi:hypothetical protein